MTARRLLVVAAAWLVWLGPAGCRQQEEASPPDNDALSVRMLVSPDASARWTELAGRGLDRIAAELGATVSRARVGEASVGRHVAAGEGGGPPDLVFCIGSGFANSLFTDAPAYPSTSFVLVPGRGHPPNVAGVDLLPAGAGYVAGVVAAHLRPAGVVGILRGGGEAWLEDLESGFVAGYRSVRRTARLAVAGSDDGPWQLAAEGAEVALYASDRPSDRVLAAAHDAGLLLVGADSAMLGRDSDVVAAALHVDLAEVMVRLAREAAAGSFTPGNYVFDLGSGVLDVRLNPTLPGNQLPALLEALEVARSEVTAGIVEMENLGM